MRVRPRAVFLFALLLAACPAPDKADDSGGGGDGCPVVVIDPESLTWTDLAPGVGATAEVSVLNNCDGETNLTLELSTTDSAFDVSPGVGSVAPGEVGTFTVTATVTEPPGASGSLQVVTNDPDHPLVSVALTATLVADGDGDGYEYGDDCDDTDPAVYPGAPDPAYDGVDADCAGDSDYDADRDGYDADAYGGDDCDDADAAISPAAVETYYDGVDANCDGRSDDDADGDGVDAADDCDDGDAEAYPGNVETWYDGRDGDCDGASDYDQDGDGGESTAHGGTDCDDTDASVYYGAPDAWYDGVDGDCAGNDDDDADYDGHPTTASGGDDCDDTDASVNPDASETWYDGVDQDCDGASDYDQDGDGVAAFDHGGSDCNDTDPATLAGSAETRNGLDDDCDGYVDEGLASPGDVVITEIMTNPAAVADTSGEWFELYNTSSYDIDLYGWVIYSDDGGSITIGSSLAVAPGAYVVLGAENDTGLNGGAHVDYEYTRSSFALSDTEGIYVMSGSTTVTGFEFDSSWPVAEGYAMVLDVTQVGDPTDVANWCVASTAMSGGDYGTPGSANDGCPQFDHDGDGYSEDDGDCDDTDAAISADGVETEDGVDQNCNALVDDIAYDVASAPYTLGEATYAYGSLSAAGDLDGDGSLELVYASNDYPTYTTTYVLDGADYATFAGRVTSYDEAAISLGSGATYGTYLPTILADNTGDGNDDLPIATSSYGDLWYLFEDPSGATGTADATVTCRATVSDYRQPGITSGDMNGDGVAEVLYGNALTSSYGTSYGGMVGVYDVSGVSGTITEASADLILRGTSANLEAGYYGLSDPGDMNGDGYLDLAVPTERHGTYVYLGDGLATTGTRDIAAEATFSFPSAYTGSYVRDVDGDGEADFLTASGTIWTNLGSASGSLVTADATTVITASSGSSCSVSDALTDMDGDGITDITMDCYYVRGSDWDYLAMFFGPDALASATADETDSFGSLRWEGWGSSSPGLVGVWDLDGDGDEEIVGYLSDPSGKDFFLER